jgi:sulfite exporter TauE/SafE
VINWLMILVGGLLGSGHCLGMCGGFALSLGSHSPSLTKNLLRQIIYSLGRVFTYSFGGAAAGYAGWRLNSEMATVVNSQSLLSIIAGLLLVTQGLASAGVIRWRWSARRKPSCLGPGLFSGLLSASRAQNVFLAGIINGLLPCGLVYAFLALAVSSADPLLGWLIMALFGLGTIPMMVLIGCGGSLLRLTWRRHIVQIAAWCVVLTGLLAVGRGFGFIQGFSHSPFPSCPACHQDG